jgi:hypothetical protein
VDEIVFVLLVLYVIRRRAAAAAPPAARAPSAVPDIKPAPPSGASVKPGDHLVHGAHYHAVLKLTGVEAVFGSAAAVKAKLESTGFTDVEVVDQGGGNFEARGVWNGGDVPAQLPSQVVSVERLG